MFKRKGTNKSGKDQQAVKDNNQASQKPAQQSGQAVPVKSGKDMESQPKKSGCC